MILFVLNLNSGSVNIPIDEIFQTLIGNASSKTSWDYIIFNYRLPKAITAILVGIGLAISGLLMQTFFRNPLAGPYVLGLSSGSSLGVAIIVLGSSLLPIGIASFFVTSYGIMIASCLGSLGVLICVLIVSEKLKNTASILIVGLMFGSFTGAIVGVLSYFSTAQELQKFTFWSLGNIGNLSWSSVLILSIVVFIGLFISFLNLKSLDALLLGENYAKSLGVNLIRSKYLIIIGTSILAGSITAFAGPIAFVGLAVPHMAKLIFQTSKHHILFFASLLLGAITMLLCDIFSTIPGTQIILPINAITSIIGAPIVIWLIIKKRNLLN